MLVCGVRLESIGGQDSAIEAMRLYFINFLLALILYAVCILPVCNVCILYTMQCTSHAHFQPKLHICYQIRELIGEICVHGGGISISYLIVRAFFSLFAFFNYFSLHCIRLFGIIQCEKRERPTAHCRVHLCICDACVYVYIYTVHPS